MDTSLLDKMRKKAKEKRDRNRKAAFETIDAEYQADIRSIESLRVLMAEADEDASGVNGSVGEKRIGPAAATREAIQAQTGNFTIRDLDEYVQQHYPGAGISRVAISSAFSKMQDKVAEIVQPAAGREPGIYRQKGAKSDESQGNDRHETDARLGPVYVSKRLGKGLPHRTN